MHASGERRLGEWRFDGAANQNDLGLFACGKRLLEAANAEKTWQLDLDQEDIRGLKCQLIQRSGKVTHD